jgi:hypothetical protein
VFPRSLVVFRPFEKCTFTESIILPIGIAHELGEQHGPKLFAVLALKYITLKLYFSLLRFVFGPSFWYRPTVFVVSKVVPPNFSSLSDCQRTSPPFSGCSHGEGFVS